MINSNNRHDVVEETRGKLDELSGTLGMQRTSKDTIHLSIVIPAYNERNRLPKTVLEAIVWCHHNVPSYEIIIADNGSSDDTVEISRLFSEYDRNVKVLCCPHLGKGATVRTGILNASGQYILFMDADGATPLAEIHKLMAKIDAGYSVAIGSRVPRLPGETKVKAALHRRIIGRTFAALVKLFAIDGISDTQCGFKIFDKHAARELFFRQKVNGFAFDVEILYLARSLGFSIVETPINYVHQSGSKVNLITDSIEMLWDVLRIRYLHWNTVKFTASRIKGYGRFREPWSFLVLMAHCILEG
jgi:dolichyl-phosphate beta-glucosyltransferase